LVQELNSCKTKKATEVLEGNSFSFGHHEGAGYIGFNGVHATSHTANDAGVKPSPEVSVTPVNEWLTNKEMLNA